jgi:hypothetical protein
MSKQSMQKKERVSNTPASHIIKKEMDNPIIAITSAMGVTI